MLDLASVDVETLAGALSDQGYDGRWLFDPSTGETGYWPSDPGYADEADEPGEHLIEVEPLPPGVWYRDMADFAEQVSDEQAARRLTRALRGKGAFRRFKDELHEEYPDLVATWNAFRDNRAAVRAVEWMRDQALVDDGTTARFAAEHPDPEVP